MAAVLVTVFLRRRLLGTAGMPAITTQVHLTAECPQNSRQLFRRHVAEDPPVSWRNPARQVGQDVDRRLAVPGGFLEFDGDPPQDKGLALGVGDP
jgi:hypothetical protein